MNNILVTASTISIDSFKGDICFVGVGQDKDGTVLTGGPLKDFLVSISKHGDFTGKEGEVALLYSELLNTDKKYKVKRICFVGFGKIAGDIDQYSMREKMRNIGGEIAKISNNMKASSIYILPTKLPVNHSVASIQALTEGVVLGSYKFNKYKKKEKNNEKNNEKNCKLASIKIGGKVKAASLRKGIKLGLVASSAVYDARDMANEPGNKWTPAEFAGYAEGISVDTRATCKVLQKKELQRLKMGGLLAVNQGSENPPKMIVVDHKPSSYSKTILLVGKGLTFDSGGVSLKPAAGMQDMKYDMCGGAAVITTMKAVIAEDPNVRIVAIVPSTDNMMSGSAVKPGDIIRHYNGITSEIINTDAEGRLILADAIAYGVDKFKPDCIIDLATLTGAVIVGLGHHYTGLMSNNDELTDKLIEAGKLAGEPLWRLPIGKEYEKQIESTVADIKNTGGKSAGTITAAEYLHKFVGDTPWAHLDIAGTAWGFTEKSYIPKGPTGIGVRTLIEFIRGWKN